MKYQISGPGMKGRQITQSKLRQTNDDNMIPLINIVFLMLIFFLVAGQISAQDSALFTAPQSRQDNRLQEADITVLLASDESVWVNGERVEGDLFEYLLSKSYSHESRVVLKVDAHLKAPLLDPLITSLQSLGIQRLRLVTISNS